jgi:hypothetical protein
MKNDVEITPVDEDAARQYIDARQTYTALEAADRALQEYRGGMIWRKQGDQNYLVRTSVHGSQKGLGARSPETKAIFEKFTTGKERLSSNAISLKAAMVRHQRMNRALRVGRTPDLLVAILVRLHQARLHDKFQVIGTNALYAYETAAGVRISSGQLATRDFDLLWDNRRKISLAVHDGPLADGMLGFLKKIDASFTLRADQQYTAINDKGFEVDILRRMGAGSDMDPQRLSQHEGDFWAVKARNADWLLSAPKYSEIVVGTNGTMVRMQTVDPRAFALFKLWMAEQSDRDPIKRQRDASQASVVVKLIESRLVQFRFDEIHVFPAAVASRILVDENGGYAISAKLVTPKTGKKL